jgi:hypothetical protein
MLRGYWGAVAQRVKTGRERTSRATTDTIATGVRPVCVPFAGCGLAENRVPWEQRCRIPRSTAASVSGRDGGSPRRTGPRSGG